MRLMTWRASSARPYKTVVLTGTFPELGGGAGQGRTLEAERLATTFTTKCTGARHVIHSVLTPRFLSKALSAEATGTMHNVSDHDATSSATCEPLVPCVKRLR